MKRYLSLILLITILISALPFTTVNAKQDFPFDKAIDVKLDILNKICSSEEKPYEETNTDTAPYYLYKFQTEAAGAYTIDLCASSEYGCLYLYMSLFDQYGYNLDGVYSSGINTAQRYPFYDNETGELCFNAKANTIYYLKIRFDIYHYYYFSPDTEFTIHFIINSKPTEHAAVSIDDDGSSLFRPIPLTIGQTVSVNNRYPCEDGYYCVYRLDGINQLDTLNFSSIGNFHKIGMTQDFASLSIKKYSDQSFDFLPPEPVLGTDFSRPYCFIIITFRTQEDFSFTITRAPVKPLAPTCTVDPGNKRITVSWNKLENATKYQIAYKLSTSKKWSYYNINDPSITCKVLYKLQSNKKYTVMVRGINVINGKSLYGPWSKSRTVKVK